MELAARRAHPHLRWNLQVLAHHLLLHDVLRLLLTLHLMYKIGLRLPWQDIHIFCTCLRLVARQIVKGGRAIVDLQLTHVAVDAVMRDRSSFALVVRRDQLRLAWHHSDLRLILLGGIVTPHL